jgi:hypothetical protein
MIAHSEDFVKHLDHPTPNDDFPALHSFGIISLPSRIITDCLTNLKKA